MAKKITIQQIGVDDAKKDVRLSDFIEQLKVSATKESGKEKKGSVIDQNLSHRLAPSF